MSAKPLLGPNPNLVSAVEGTNIPGTRERPPRTPSTTTEAAAATAEAEDSTGSVATSATAEGAAPAAPAVPAGGTPTTSWAAAAAGETVVSDRGRGRKVLFRFT